jgi:hypothetical protein
MKYLKPYKIFESKEEYLDNDSINWEVIESAKDLALEHLDDGSKLEFNIDYKSSDQYVVLSGLFSHEKDNLDWNKRNSPYTKFDKENLIYSFQFKFSSNVKIDDSEELTNRLKEMYPDVNIVNDRWSGYGPVEALRQLLIYQGMSDEDIYSISSKGYKHYGANIYSLGYDEEFISITKQKAYKVAEEYISGLADEEVLNTDLYFRFDCVDGDSLANSLVEEEYYRQDWKYIEDIKDDENGEIDEEGLKKYMEQEIENIKYDIKDYITIHFGKESVFGLIKEHLYTDWLKRITDGIVKADGLGNTLGTYDGEEYIEEYDGIDYHIFRIN